MQKNGFSLDWFTRYRPFELTCRSGPVEDGAVGAVGGDVGGGVGDEVDPPPPAIPVGLLQPFTETAHTTSKESARIFIEMHHLTGQSARSSILWARLALIPDSLYIVACNLAVTAIIRGYLTRPITDILYSTAHHLRGYPISMPNRGLFAAVLSHVPFEDLGSLQRPLEERGFTIKTLSAPTAQFPSSQASSCDLLIVLGGPIGVYESEANPFLNGEIDCIRERLAAKRPVLGICLGAQLMAAAAGARVYPGIDGPEIGWAPIEYAGTWPPPAWFAPLVENGPPIFHWHGDTFDLPPDATLLARTDVYENQAFAIGENALALQFHPEVTAVGLERWYVGHAFELARRKISVAELRAAGIENAPRLETAAERFWKLWLDRIF